MNCGKYQSQFNDYLDGDLSLREREKLQHHLKECLPCYRKWSSLQKTQEILHQLPALDPPEHLSAVVMARLKNRRLRRPPWFFANLPRWLPLGVGATLLFLISVGLWQVMPSQYPWQSLFPSSRKNGTTTTRPAEPSQDNLTRRKGEPDSSAPVMVLRVKDFSRADQELQSMLRSFTRPPLSERESSRSSQAKSVRLFQLQVPGQRLPHLLRELHKIGHLDQGQVERQTLANPGQQQQVSIRIVVVSSGSDVEIRQLREGK
jgi:hypothetical protein